MNSSHDGNGTHEEHSRARGHRPAHGEPLLDRAFRMLACFGPDTPVLSLTALASRADLPKATALRIARQLTEQGALELTDSGLYTIGLRLLEIATVAPRGHGLRTIARPTCKTSGSPHASTCNWSYARAWKASSSSGCPHEMPRA
ncbi:helix-turn-helix domain-containing protein [Streptomyces nigrescens]